MPEQQLSLLERAVRRLNQSFHAVVRRAKPASRGFDGVSVRQFERTWPAEKQRLLDELRRGTYSFQPLVGVVVPKDRTRPMDLANSRPISIPAVRDRVVQRSILLTLWPHVRDRVHTAWSFGGVPAYPLTSPRKVRPSENTKKSVRRAIEAIVSHRDNGYPWIFETDIQSFFPSIDQSRLFGLLQSLLPDNSLDDLLKSALKTEVANADRLGEYSILWDQDSGVPQGGVLSPLLANLYLADFDAEVSKYDVKLIRYVDDLVVACRTKEAAFQIFSTVRDLLAKLGLRIHEIDHPDAKNRIKTRIVDPGKEFHFLGTTFFKTSIVPRKENIEKLMGKIDLLTDVRNPKALSLDKLVVAMNALVVGWINSYSYCNISSQQLTDLDTRVRSRVGGWLQEHGFCRHRNVVDDRRARLLGLRSACSVKLSPIIKR